MKGQLHGLRPSAPVDVLIFDMDVQVEVACLRPAVEAGDPDEAAVEPHAAEPVIRSSRPAGGSVVIVKPPVHADHEPCGLVALEQTEVDLPMGSPDQWLALVVGDAVDGN